MRPRQTSSHSPASAAVARFEEFYPWRDAHIVRVLVVALFVLPTGLILGLGTEISTKPWYTLALAIGLPFVLGAIFLFGGMRTTIEGGTLRVRLRPFIDRRVPLHEIEAAEAVRLDPAERGRRLPYAKGRVAFSLHDDQGVEVRLRGGGVLLIGSTDPEGLVEALRQTHAADRGPDAAPAAADP